MKVKYCGSTPADTIAGNFQPNEVKDVPDNIAEQLLSGYGFEKVVEPKIEKEEEEDEE